MNDVTALNEGLKNLRDDIHADNDIDKTKSARVAYFLYLEEVTEINNLTVEKPSIPSDIQNAADKSLDIADYISEDHTDRKHLESNQEILDNLYSELMPDREYLKSNGQFFTPESISDFMMSIDGLENCSSVLDPACGPGAFLDSISRHSTDITAVDKDPLLVYAAMVRSCLNNYYEDTTFEVADYIRDFDPDTTYDLIIGNPPYNKFHNYENSIDELFNIEPEYDMGQFANLYAQFFLKSTDLVSEGGYIVFLTPTEYLQTEYGEALKSIFKKNFNIEMFVKIDWESDVFDALTTVCVTVLQKDDKGKENNDVEFYVSDTPEDVKSIADRSADSRNIKQSELQPDSKWNQHFQQIEYREYLDSTIPLSELADTKRGIATGYNDYFTLSETEVRNWDIEDTYLQRVLIKSVSAKNYVLNDADFESLTGDNNKTYLLYYQDGMPVSENLRTYIEHGESIDADDRYLTKNRDPWYSMEERDPAPILATVFSRNDMRFIHNRADALNLAAFHGVYPKVSDTRSVKSLLAYLNSDIALELAKTQHRQYADGLSKFEPGDLSEIPTIDIHSLNQTNKEKLSSLFDQLDTARRDGDEKEVRERLNKHVISIFENLTN